MSGDSLDFLILKEASRPVTIEQFKNKYKISYTIEGLRKRFKKLVNSGLIEMHDSYPTMFIITDKGKGVKNASQV